jgi:hypothetical protein
MSPFLLSSSGGAHVIFTAVSPRNLNDIRVGDPEGTEKTKIKIGPNGVSVNRFLNFEKVFWFQIIKFNGRVYPLSL